MIKLQAKLPRKSCHLKTKRKKKKEKKNKNKKQKQKKKQKKQKNKKQKIIPHVWIHIRCLCVVAYCGLQLIKINKYMLNLCYL